ncbi:SDR family oxidoreductase [Hahella sp. SMD15-11]|uniref:SDR family oxidoreductase n=1 Tax=Thermohahella caldifontis TaxID=3142973 RepID=A0AB39USG4_9GAMM
MYKRLQVLVTGATGFVGRAVVQSLKKHENIDVSLALRAKSEFQGCTTYFVEDFNGRTDWTNILSGQNVIIHTAARSHIMKDECSDPLLEYRRVNVYGTLNLARQAATLGIKRFIFISSIKVNGETTKRGYAFSEADYPQPEGAYAISKFEAEQGLWDIQCKTGMEVVIIRPPLVYGPGVKGNFANIIYMIKKGVPLPLGAIHNKRSLVARDNLVDLLVTCIEHPAAANQVFLAGDGQDLSTTELLRKIGRAVGKPARLVPVPEKLLWLGARLAGKEDIAQRLLGSLQVDISKARSILGWTPPVTLEEGLRRCFWEASAH